MEYFEELELDPECPIPSAWLKSYVDNVISIVKRNQVDTFFKHLNSINPHIKFIMESPYTDGSNPFLVTKCLCNKDHSMQSSVDRKPTHTDWYLDWNCTYPIPVKDQ